MLTAHCCATSVTWALQTAAADGVVAEVIPHPKSQPENLQATNAKHVLA